MSSGNSCLSTPYDCDNAFGASPNDSIENGEKPSESSSPNEKKAFAGPCEFVALFASGMNSKLSGRSKRAASCAKFGK
jgi:hypothetical protein